MPALWTGTPRDWDAGLQVTSTIGNSEWRDRFMYLKDSPALTGNVTIAGTLAVTGVTTLTAAPVLSALTASVPVFTNGSKALVSNAMTGTGSVVMSTSPQLVTPLLGTPTSGVATNLTGLVAANMLPGTFGGGAGYIFGTNLATNDGITFRGTVVSTTHSTITTRSATAASLTAADITGASLLGYGTTNDVTLMNRAGNYAIGVTANTVNVTMGGNLAITGALSGVTTLATSSTINGQTISSSAALTGSLAITGALSGVTTLATSSTINGQTISSAANFTGTMAIGSGGGATITLIGAAANGPLITTNIAGGAKYNAAFGYNYNASETFEWTPSTAAGGSTFSTPVMTLTRAGLLTVSGLGTHSFTSTTAGEMNLNVRGNNSSAASLGKLTVGNNTSSTILQLFAWSSGNTGSGWQGPNVATIYAENAAGLSIVSGNGSGDIRFYAGGTVERMSLSSAGLLTIKAGARFDGADNTSLAEFYNGATFNGNFTLVSASSALRFTAGTSRALILAADDSSTKGIVISTAGAIRFATGYGAGSATFDASGNITSVSDERLKTISGTFERGLEAVLALRPIRYRWNDVEPDHDREHEYTGFGAQSVQQVIPEAVFPVADGKYLSLQDRPILAATVNAIKELNNRLAALEAKLLKETA